MTKDTLDAELWKPRSVAETVAIYRDWSATYDEDVLSSGYVTPTRAATALAPVVDLAAPVLDFGCGTGLSGLALRDAGFATIDGTDITPEMLERARAKDIYRRLWPSTDGDIGAKSGVYKTILAAGVISLGAAPPETLRWLLELLPTGGHLAFSYNDPTLEDAAYVAALDAAVAEGHSVVFRDHGPHLPEKGMGSDVIILRKA